MGGRGGRKVVLLIVIEEEEEVRKGEEGWELKRKK